MAGVTGPLPLRSKALRLGIGFLVTAALVACGGSAEDVQVRCDANGDQCVIVSPDDDAPIIIYTEGNETIVIESERDDDDFYVGYFWGSLFHSSPHYNTGYGYYRSSYRPTYTSNLTTYRPGRTPRYSTPPARVTSGGTSARSTGVTSTGKVSTGGSSKVSTGGFGASGGSKGGSTGSSGS